MFTFSSDDFWFGWFAMSALAVAVVGLLLSLSWLAWLWLRRVSAWWLAAWFARRGCPGAASWALSVLPAVPGARALVCVCGALHPRGVRSVCGCGATVAFVRVSWRARHARAVRLHRRSHR